MRADSLRPMSCRYAIAVVTGPNTDRAPVAPVQVTAPALAHPHELVDGDRRALGTTGHG